MEGEAVSLQQGMQLLPLARFGLGAAAAAAADCVRTAASSSALLSSRSLFAICSTFRTQLPDSNPY